MIQDGVQRIYVHVHCTLYDPIRLGDLEVLHVHTVVRRFELYTHSDPQTNIEYAILHEFEIRKFK